LNATEHTSAEGTTRRDFLSRAGAVSALAAGGVFAPFAISGCGRASGPEPVKIGLLHSQTGTMAISETGLRDAGVLAIEEINAAGGVLGRPIEPVIEDTRSRMTDLFPKKSRKLLAQDGVSAIFGCWTSSSRKAVLPVLEELNGLLFYPVQYEGNESSPNVIYTGAAPNQQILPAIDWLLSSAGGSRKRFYLIGSDYIFPRTANFIIVKYLQSRGLTVAGESYSPLGHRDYSQAVKTIIKADADVIFNTINGDSNIAFYDALAAAGITADKIPVVATSIGEDELRSLLPSRVAGHLAAWNYFQSIDTPQNKRFVKRFQEERGWDRVTSDPMEAAYFQIYLWKLAVEKAGDFGTDKVRDALRTGITYEAPGGLVKVDPKTQHTYKRFRMGKVRDDRQFDIIFEAPEWTEPEPYPQVAFPGWHCDWTKGGITKGPEVKISAG
jgi:urea transport system substrate-binding protein